jgi:hypothetical protein
MKLMDAALFAAANHVRELAWETHGEGLGEAGEALEAIADMLSRAADGKRSPLIAKLISRTKGKHDHPDKAEAKRYARLWALLAMRDLGRTKYEAAKLAADFAGITRKNLEHLIPVADDLPKYFMDEDGREDWLNIELQLDHFRKSPRHELHDPVCAALDHFKGMAERHRDAAAKSANEEKRISVLFKEAAPEIVHALI